MIDIEDSEEKIKRQYKRLFIAIEDFNLVMELNGLDYNCLVVNIEGRLSIPIDKYRYYIAKSFNTCFKSPSNLFKPTYISDTSMVTTNGSTRIQLVVAPLKKYTKKIKNKEAKSIQRTYIPFFELFVTELKNYEKLFDEK